MDKITTGGQGPKMGRSKDLYRYYSVRRAAKMGAYVYMGRFSNLSRKRPSCRTPARTRGARPQASSP